MLDVFTIKRGEVGEGAIGFIELLHQARSIDDSFEVFRQNQTREFPGHRKPQLLTLTFLTRNIHRGALQPIVEAPAVIK